jgi:CheY-like chemotaxis protein
MTPAVLIVEDERILADAIAAYLGRHGFEPTVVDSAEAALEHAGGAEVDLVVLDHHLPGMDGVEALGRLKQLLPAIEVVMLTAHGSVKAAVAAMRAGAFEYLTKPVDLEELTLCSDAPPSTRGCVASCAIGRRAGAPVTRASASWAPPPPPRVCARTSSASRASKARRRSSSPARPARARDSWRGRSTTWGRVASVRSSS